MIQLGYFAALAAAGLAQSPANPPWFRAEHPAALAAEASWRAVAWNDLDGDGDPDVVLSRDSGVVLLENRTGNLVRAREYLADRFDAEGMVAADLNNDGRIDLFVTNRSGPPRYFLNEGRFAFEVQTGEHASLGTDSRAVCAADFNGDGWLDLVVVTGDGTDDVLLQNIEGKLLARASLRGSGGEGRTCAVGDWNEDGRPDIYIGNFLVHREGDVRRATDSLYRNLGGFRFAAETSGHVVNSPSMTYGAASIDWNEDGGVDLSVSHDGRADRNVLYENRVVRGKGIDLYPRGEELGLAVEQRGPSKGHAWGDYDNDGDFDVFYAEGTEGLPQDAGVFDVRDEIYERDGNRFSRRVEPDVDRDDRLGAGVAHADFDRDGDLDLLVCNWGGNAEKVQFYRNVRGGHSIAVSLLDESGNVQAIGARIELRFSIDGVEQTRRGFVWPQTGYGSMNEPGVHFGFAQPPTVISVKLVWPDGKNEVLDVERQAPRYRFVRRNGVSSVVPADDSR